MNRKNLFYLIGVVSIFILLFIFVIVNKSSDDITVEKYKIMLNGDYTIRLQSGNTFSDPGFVVYNSKNEKVNIYVDVKSDVNTNNAGKYKITYSIGGDILATREVVVEPKVEEKKDDNYIFELVGGNEINILKGYEYVDPLYIAKTKNGEDLSKKVSIIGGADITKEGRYEIHYFLNTGSFQLEKIRIVNVISEKVEFSLNGNEKIELNNGERYVEKGAKASYNGDDYKNSITITGEVDTNVAGEYTIVYTLKTPNFIASLKRMVIVKDKNPPKEIDFKLVGDENVNIYQGEFYDETGFTAVDSDGNDYKDLVKVNSNLNISEVGVYSIKYYLKVDEYEKTLERHINVIKRLNVDFRLFGNSDVEIEEGGLFFDQMFTAIGEDGIDYSSQVVIKNNVNPNVIGTYYVTYELSVKGFNKILTRKVTVKKKEAIIDFRLQGFENITLNVNEKFNDPGFVAGDSDGNNLRQYVKVFGNVDTSKVGTYSIKYTLNYNNYNNTLTRYVKVIGNNYSLSKITKNGNVVVTITNHVNNFGYFITPDSKKTTKGTVTYTLTKNGKYNFYMYDKNGKKIDTIVVSVDSIDNKKPTASCSAVVSNKKVTYTVKATDASGIDKYVHAGKTYTDSKFTVSNNNENDSVRVYDKKGNYTDVSCVYQPISAGSRSVVASYNSSTLKYWTEKGGQYFVVTHVWVKDAYNQMNVEVNTRFGTLEKTKTILDNVIKKYGYSNKGMVAVNASGFIMSAGSNYENYVKEWRLSPTAPVIFTRGNLVRDFTKYTLPGTTPVYGLKKNGYLTYYNFGSGSGAVANNQKIVQQMKNDGIRNTMSFSPVLVKDYQVVTKATDNNIRQAICQIDKNNFVIITNTNGTSNRGVGFNHKAMAEYMVKLNCRTGYNLDGGGSTNFYYKKNNTTISSIVSTSRNVADILYFVE